MQNHLITQKGATLILMAFIIGLVTTVYLLKSYNPVSIKIEQNKKTYEALAEAKEALIAWSVSNSINPGQLPYPDRNADGNYDGKSDCPSPVSPFSYSFLIGQLPIFGQTNPCISPQVGLGIDNLDKQGNRLWYAVSRNLVHKYNPPTLNPIINPSIIQTPTYPWLRILDQNGLLISDRVVAVIVAPNVPVGNQNRVGLAGVINYLDTFLIGAVTFSNSDYDSDNEDFVLNKKAIDVNDQLIYITADELIYALEKRVLEEVKNKLTAFYKANNYYPFAAGLGLAVNKNQCVQGNYRGLLPVVMPSNHTCSCTALDKTCRCNFSIVNKVSFTRNSGEFIADWSPANSPTGACSVNILDTKTCTCAGSGACNNATGIKEFECNTCGDCSAAIDGTNTFYTTGTFVNSTGECTHDANLSNCVNSSNGSFTLAACNNDEILKTEPNPGGLLPAWFKTNEWEQYIVYAVSNNCVSNSSCKSNTSPPKITVGLNKNVNAVVAGSMTKPNNSCGIASYLNSDENINMQVNNGMQDDLYQQQQLKTQTNSDQIVVIP